MNLEMGKDFTIDDDFLTSPDFDKEAKIQHFDELKRKYLEMLDTYEQVERQLKDLEEQDEEKVKVNKGKNIIGDSLEEPQARYEEIKEDSTVPEGWKCAWRRLEGFSKGKWAKNFWAPNGKFFGSRVSAMRYMLVDLGLGKSKEMEVMRTGLLQEEWEEHSCLPRGWLCADESRLDNGEERRSKKFVTETYVSLRNMRAAVKHMVVHCTEEEMATFLSSFSMKVSRIISWLHNPAIPTPWHLAKTEVISFLHSFFDQLCCTFASNRRVFYCLVLMVNFIFRGELQSEDKFIVI